MTTHSDQRVAAARNYLATAPPTDFTKLLGDVVDVAQDFEDTELDQNVTQVLDEGGVYLAPGDFLDLCPACRSRVDEIVTVKM
jgi:hypothetical protein